jgi:hypothetical protein
MIRATLALLTLLLCGSLQAQQGEAAAMKRATELRDAPADSGRSLASLPQQEPVTRLGERQGAWIQVQTRAGVSGWVHMFDVGPAGSAGSAAGNVASSAGNAVTGGLRGLTSMLRGSPQAPTVATSTIGIRGLGAEDLARAQPNVQAVGQMDQLRQGENEARAFAAEASLAAAVVPELPLPSRLRAPQSGATPGQQP